MEKPLSEQLVDSILDGSKESFMAAFNAALAAKVTDALEVKKVEIASTLMGSPVPTEELAVEEEVDLEESKKEMKDDEEEDDEEEMDDEEESDDEEDEKDMKEEAKGKVAVTPKEKALAAHHGDKSRITYGDVVKARIKSAKNEEVEQIDEISTDLIKKSRMIARKKAADADERGKDVEWKIHAAQAGRFQKALDNRDRKAQLSRVSGAKARKFVAQNPDILAKEEVEQIDEVTPPGREKQVKALKGKVRNPYAVAWASYNKSKKNK